jgi:hypothetical protein
MGTWNPGNFDNDDAQDWLLELQDAVDTDVIEEALGDVVENGGYVEAPDAQQAVAAAEIVAAMAGHPAHDLPAAAAAWAQLHGHLADQTLLALAERVVRRIQDHSELPDLWAGGDRLDEWDAAIDDLRARLGEAGAP